MLTKAKLESINDDQVPTSGKLSRASTLVPQERHTSPKDADSTEPITYDALRRILLRRHSLLNDTKTLLNQYLDTMAVLKRLCLCSQRSSPQAPSPVDFEIVHLHTTPDLTIFQLYATLAPDNLASTAKCLPAIFPVAPGVWELLVGRSHLATLRETALLDLRIPTELPKGIVARAAQSRTGVDPRDRYVSRIYIGLVQRFPWRQIVEDASQAFTILHPPMAWMGTSFCEFALYDDHARTRYHGSPINREEPANVEYKTVITNLRAS
ncbi:MAG: hypothetical protein LQ342_001086 [Letrouitia transgressa]|nr:MAG: hypothetical protein LQ342_001086 [Letrouitia transgressa]